MSAANRQLPVKLYSCWRSSASWRVRIVLNLKRIDYTYEPVDHTSATGFIHSKEYGEINPAELVPSLVIDGHTLTESMAIIEYLNETRPNPALLPADAADKAKVRAMCLRVVSGIQPLQNFSVLKRLGEQQSEQWAKYWILHGFEGLEKMVAKTTGKYSFGDTITIADACLVPQVYNAHKFGLDMTKFPNLSRIYSSLMQLDAFKETHPFLQPDYPKS